MINIKNLYKKFNNTIIFKDMNISFKEKKSHILLGPSGIGKSTLLNIISGIDSNYDGIVDVNTNSLAYVFQEDRLLPWLNIEENIDFVLKEKKDYTNILKMLEINSLRTKIVRNLSGGQKQRVSIARAFATNPKLLIMDESLKSLDLELKSKIIKKINFLLNKNETTMIYVSHDIQESLFLADSITILNKNGQIEKQIEITLAKDKRNINHPEFLRYESIILNTLHL